MVVRTDGRLLDAPMRPVRCRSCGSSVEVRKSSWDQTSIQWHDEAVRSCAERRAAQPGPGPNGQFFTGCTALRDSVRAAAARGEIPIQEE
ncbi:ferredoxin [Saccharopolyspora sp. NPDC000359]|uniref:ferredoxin n=1 Tax=Saccharopolyspora sp. NPDC000359 TaxID=3154251 RepID=UPI003331DA44